MRKYLLSAAAIALAASAVQASQISVVLGMSPSTGTASTAGTSLVTTAGASVKVYIFAKTDTLQDPASETGMYQGADYTDNYGQTVAGGIRGFGFNVTSNGTGKINFNTPANSATTFNATGFTVIKPSHTDVGGDGDFDANGGSISDTAGFTNVTLGTSESSTKMTSGPFAGYDLIATENWTVSATPGAGDTLSVAVVGPTYYDGNSSSNFQSSFTQTVATPVTFSVPEPASVGLLSLGAMGLIARRRRA